MQQVPAQNPRDHNLRILLQVRVNFPNPDMVGHTGDLDATIYACGVVDQCVQVRGSSPLLDASRSACLCRSAWLAKTDNSLKRLSSTNYSSARVVLWRGTPQTRARQGVEPDL